MLKFQIELNRVDKRDKEVVLQDIQYLLSRRAEEQRIIDAAKEAMVKIDKIDSQLIKLSRELWEVM